MKSFRITKDKTAALFMLILTILFILILIIIGGGLYLRSSPLLEIKSLDELITSGKWRPLKGEFGFFAFIMGTIWVTMVSITIALPLCILCAIYLSEYAHQKIKNIIYPIIDLLSGIPPIVYGVWGILVVVPMVKEHIAPHFKEFSSGYSILAGGIVLAIMIFPLIISVLTQVFHCIPEGLREASLSLGSTKWETFKYVILRKSFPGIIAATVLAISRALGETIAVLMVCGNTPLVPLSIFDPGYPLPALIANNYGEMFSIPLYDSALLMAAFILFIIIFLFNAVSRIILIRLENQWT